MIPENRPTGARCAEGTAGDGRGILFPVCIASFLVSLDITVLNIAAPAVAARFDVGLSVMSRLVLVYALPLIALGPAAGRLADRLGHGRSLSLGFALFGAGSLLCGLAPSIHALTAFRCIQGVGGAFLYALGPALIACFVPPERQGRAFGLLALISPAAFCLGPSLGGFVTAHLGWRWVFLLNAPLAALGARFVPNIQPASRSGAGERPAAFDGLGALWLALFLAGLLFCLNLGKELGWASPTILGSLAVAVCALVLMLRRELAVPHPLLDLRLFGIRSFSLGLAGMFLFMFVLGGMFFLLPFYLVGLLGLSADRAGLVYMIPSATMVLVSPWAGRLADVWSRRGMSALGCLGMAVSLFMLAGLNGRPSELGLVCLALCVMGIGEGVFSSPNLSLTMLSAPAGQQGVASAVLTTLRSSAQVIGLAGLEAVFSQVGEGSSAAASLAAYRTVFVLSGLVAGAAAIVSARTREP